MEITDKIKLPSKEKRNNWLEKYARFGYLAKGVVYCLTGILAAMTAFGLGGQNGGKFDSIRFVLHQPFGRILLAIIATGLMGYVTWRLIQAIKDPRNKGTDKKGIANRIGYAFSGLTYLGLAFYSAKIAFENTSGNDGGGSSRQSFVSEVLSWPAGQLLIGAAALFFIGKGFWQFYRAFSGKFMKHISAAGKSEKTYKTAGIMGYAARGVVLCIIGYFFIRAAIESNAKEAKNTEGVFNFLKQNGGPFMLALVALGLVAYGLFMFVKARYETVDVED